jgi:hypothetical protein
VLTLIFPLKVKMPFSSRLAYVFLYPGLASFIFRCIMPVKCPPIPSGEASPPKTPSLLQDIRTSFSTVLKWVSGIGVAAFVAWWLLPSDWQVKYASEYMLDIDKVVLEHNHTTAIGTRLLSATGTASMMPWSLSTINTATSSKGRG